MGATSVTGVSGKGAVISTNDKLKNISDNILTVNNGLSNVNNKISVVGKFSTDYYENFSAIMNHRLADNGAVRFGGGGLFVVPATSDRSCCSCSGYWCDNWCCPCSCNCNCGLHHNWFLMAVNADQMEFIEWSGRWKWSDIDFAQFTNTHEIYAENFTNSMLTIDGFKNLYNLVLKFGTVSNDLTISNNPDLGTIRIKRTDIQSLTIDWDTCQNLYQIDLSVNSWNSDRIDDILISFAKSLVKYPRSGWYISVGSGENASPTIAAAEAIDIINNNGWDVFYN